MTDTQVLEPLCDLELDTVQGGYAPDDGGCTPFPFPPIGGGDDERIGSTFPW